MIVVIVILCLGVNRPAEHVKERSLWMCGEEIWDEDRRLNVNVWVVIMFIFALVF
jgi:hypothetical protein